ncbi:MAG TPA: hypothetical protein PK400_02115 [Phycisphaerales bacterium]|nr:hypothetical protein [Phycisphaerales bacterium]HRQ75219.1 hypothetical protein [Phycisphaerales bacterium]
MPQETKSIADLNHTELQGTTVHADDQAALRKAIELAVDYRGDVTLKRCSTGETIECFLFDLKGGAEPTVRAMLPDESRGNRIAIPLSDIASICFSGRDTAAGKSFETWMKKYVQKKLAGETASIESERLD